MAEQITIRAAGPGDDYAVSALIADYAADFDYDLGDQDVVGEGRHAREYYESGGLIIAQVGDDIVGCVAFEPWGEEGRARMKRLYVERDQRGKGIGRGLSVAVMEAAKDAGFDTMVLDTTKGMVEARALYADLGFEEWEPDYEAPCVGTVYMRRSL